MRRMHRLIKLGDQEYALRYTINSVCCLEERFGKALHSLLCTDVSSVRALLWCALLDQYSLTLEQAGDLLDQALDQGRSLTDIGACCAGALNDAGFFRPAEER